MSEEDPVSNAGSAVGSAAAGDDGFHAPTFPTYTKEEAEAAVRKAGWTEKTAIDYEGLKNYRENEHYQGAALRYEAEWDGDLGDVGPEVPELEQQMFNSEFQQRSGEHFNNLDFNVTVEGPTMVERLLQFEDAGLHKLVLDNIKKLGYKTPTAVQQYAIPAVLKGTDLVAVAQTGSGKTAAYLIPIISKLMGKIKKLGGPKPTSPNETVKAEPLVVIIVPTRELAIQIFKEACRLSYRSMMRPCVNYGGFPSATANAELRKGCDILIGTPGRLASMVGNSSLASFARVKYTVIDEADELLDPDWEEDMRKIMTSGDNNNDADRTYLMFSATFPKEARRLARDYLTEDHARIRVGRVGSAHKNVLQEVIFADEGNKQIAVLDYLIKEKPMRTIIFCNSKYTVDRVDDFLYNNGLPTTSLHSDRMQMEREDAMHSFVIGKTPILVTTGVAARGWDISALARVINYDLPSADHGGIDEYVHRIGRTGRIGNRGYALSFYNDRNEDIAEQLTNVLLENDCQIPSFLEQYKPEDNVPKFDDDSDEELDGGASVGYGDNGFGMQAQAGFENDTGFEAQTGSADVALGGNTW